MLKNGKNITLDNLLVAFAITIVALPSIILLYDVIQSAIQLSKLEKELREMEDGNFFLCERDQFNPDSKRSSQTNNDDKDYTIHALEHSMLAFTVSAGDIFKEEEKEKETWPALPYFCDIDCDCKKEPWCAVDTNYPLLKILYENPVLCMFTLLNICMFILLGELCRGLYFFIFVAKKKPLYYYYHYFFFPSFPTHTTMLQADHPSRLLFL